MSNSLLKKSSLLKRFIIIFSIVIISGIAVNMVFAASEHLLSAELVSINENNNTLVFKMKSGEEYKAIAPEIVIPLLEKNKTYVVNISQKKWGPPRLTSIGKVPVPE